MWQQLVAGQKTVVELEASARSERETLMSQKTLLEQEIHELIAAKVRPQKSQSTKNKSQYTAKKKIHQLIAARVHP